MVISDLKRISVNSLGFSIGTILTQFIGFFLLPLYTRYLTPADYGILSVTASISSILSIIITFGLRGSLGRFYFDYYKNPDELKSYIGTICLSTISLSLILTMGLFLFGAPLFQIISPDIPFYPYLVLVIWTTFLSIPLNYLLVLLQVREKSFFYSLFTVAQFVISVGLIIYFVVFFKEGALGSLKGTFICGVVFFLIALFFLKNEMSHHIDLLKLTESLAYGLPLVPHMIAGWIMNLFDRIILNHFRDLTEVGIYSLGYTFGSLMSIVTLSINFAWAPYFMSTVTEKGESAKKTFSTLSTYYVAFILFVGLGISLFSLDLIRLMTTPAYFSAYEIVPIIVLAYIFNGLYFMVVNQIFFLKKTKFLVTITFSTAVISIVSNLILVPVYGIIGAACSCLISYAFMFVLTFFVSHHLYPIPYEYARIAKIFIVAGVVFCISVIIGDYPFFSDIVIKSGIILLYPVGLLICGIFTKEEFVAAKLFLLNLLHRVSLMLYRQKA